METYLIGLISCVEQHLFPPADISFMDRYPPASLGFIHFRQDTYIKLSTTYNKKQRILKI